ncbi:nucleotide pyrophosphohydrolase [candidate division KSB1 bacterium]
MGPGETLAELGEICKNFRDERDWKQYHNLKDMALAMAIEVAEVLEHVRFKDIDEVKNYLEDSENRRQVGHELADILYFLLLISDEIGINLAESFKEKMKIAAEKYPVELARGRNLKYTELREE